MSFEEKILSIISDLSQNSSMKTYDFTLTPNNAFVICEFTDTMQPKDVRFLISQSNTFSSYFTGVVPSYDVVWPSIIVNNILMKPHSIKSRLYLGYLIKGEKRYVVIYSDSDDEETFKMTTFTDIIGEVIEIESKPQMFSRLITNEIKLQNNAGTYGVCIGQYLGSITFECGTLNAGYINTTQIALTDLTFEDARAVISIGENNVVQFGFSNMNLSNIIAKNVKEDNEERLAALEAKVEVLESKG